MKSLVAKSLAFLFVFMSLVFYNYKVAQKKIAETKESVIKISVATPHTSVKLSEPISFNWNIEAPKDFKTNFTTIFYSYTSSPSALTKKDSPSAVGYQFSIPDYKFGSFTLPDSFVASVFPTKVGRLWYRAYTKLRDDHLWTEEKFIDVLP